jgi:hypothetical protein
MSQGAHPGCGSHWRERLDSGSKTTTSECISVQEIPKRTEIAVSSNQTHADTNNSTPIQLSASAVLNVPAATRDVRNR